MKAYRVVTGEPDGITIGFDPAMGWPSNDHLATSDEYELTADDGGDNVFITSETTIVVSKALKHGELWPEPDLHVWRTPEAFKRWVHEIFG